MGLVRLFIHSIRPASCNPTQEIDLKVVARRYLAWGHLKSAGCVGVNRGLNEKCSSASVASGSLIIRGGRSNACFDCNDCPCVATLYPGLCRNERFVNCQGGYILKNFWNAQMRLNFVGLFCCKCTNGLWLLVLRGERHAKH